LSDIIGALDRGDFAVLTLLELSAAFDTVDHSTLLRRLQTSHGIQGTVLHWFKSYLHNCQQSVQCKSDSSTPSLVVFGVPQGSVLGPILFLLYTADILGVVRNRNLHVQLCIFMLTIHKYTAFVACLKFVLCKTMCPHALMTLQYG